MDKSFWLERWEQNDIGFHEGAANPLLVKYFTPLSVPVGNRVFVPLCGKTLDIAWLLGKGYHVAGAELSEMAVQQLFEGLGVEPTVMPAGELIHYSAPGIDIYVGDIFALTAEELGPVDAIYDRAALVALPEILRQKYTAHLMDITRSASQLLINYEYDQSLMEGPPFSISADEVRRHYGDRYQLTHLESKDVPGGVKGKCPATENVWLLQKA